MTTAARPGDAQRARFQELETRLHQEVCANCGRDLTIAWHEHEYRLRCGRCGYDPPTRYARPRSLRLRYKQGDPLSALERQQLWRQLYREVTANEPPDPAAVRLFRRLEAEMRGENPQALTVRTGAGQLQQYTPNDLAVLRQTVAPDLNDAELRLFLTQAIRRGLDPFAKQVYGIKRRRRRDGNWEDYLVLQTGIDGYRAICDRAGDVAGMDDIEYGPMVPDPHVVGGAHPEWARATVYKLVAGHRVPFSATVWWDERVQLVGAEARRPNDAWSRMPRTMLAKCAEALARRLGWPEQLRGMEYAEAAPPVVVDPVTGEVYEGEPLTEAEPQVSAETSDSPDAAPPTAAEPPAGPSSAADWVAALDGAATAAEVHEIWRQLPNNLLSVPTVVAARDRAIRRFRVTPGQGRMA
jgi:phage recombination protein Bet